MQPANERYQVKVNEQVLSISSSALAQADMIMSGEGHWHLIVNNQSIGIEILGADLAAKQLSIRAQGNRFEVTISDALDQLLMKMGFDKRKPKHENELRAPMPGLVKEVLVQEGEACKAAQTIIILQAMKMENSMATHADCTVKKINVKPGQAVEKGQVLIEFE